MRQGRFVAFAIALIGVLLSVGTAYAADCPSDLSAYYTFDSISGNAVPDLSGNGNTGTAANGFALATGKRGNAASFSGLSYITVPKSSSLDSALGGQSGLSRGQTISFWISPSSSITPSSTSTYGLLQYEGEFFVMFNTLNRGGGTFGNPGKLIYSIRQYPPAGEGANNLNFPSSQSSWTAGSWYHVALTFDVASRTASIYINGQLDGATNWPYIVRDWWSGTLNIGSANGLYNFTGRMDDLAIYSRALSASEIADIYSSGAGKEICPVVPVTCANSLVGYYTLDGTGTSMGSDSSGSGNNGQISGSVSSVQSGKFGNASSFSGSGSINIPSLSFPTNQYTISGWVRTSQAAQTEKWRNWLIKNDGENTPFEMHIGDGRVGSGPNGPRFAVWIYGKGAPVNIDNNSINMRDGQWHFMAATYMKGQQVLYHNGIEVARSSFTGNLPVTSSPVRIGGGQLGAYHTLWIGDVDDVMIFNRSMSSDEIATLYNGGVGSSFCAAAPPITCTDPDGGLDNTTFSGVSNSTVSISDSCIGTEYVNERYCGSGENSGRVLNTTMFCTYGCVAGACLQAPVSPCTDPDATSQQNLTKTTTTNNTASGTDFCIGSSVNEYYCNEGDVASIQMFCINGCSNGACNVVEGKSFVVPIGGAYCDSSGAFHVTVVNTNNGPLTSSDWSSASVTGPGVDASFNMPAQIPAKNAAIVSTPRQPVTATDTYTITLSTSDSSQSIPLICDQLQICNPDCAGKMCGDDGCGGSCGGCTSDMECVSGACVAVTPPCSGCIINGRCVSIGYRFDFENTPAYCDFSGTIAQKVNLEGSVASCSNNFECSSNLCSSGQCVEVQGLQAMFVSVFCRLFNMLDENGYQRCLSQNMYGVGYNDRINCGDGICQRLEEVMCPQDCGPTCMENWACTDWSACADGVQTRVCTDSKGCRTNNLKPAEVQSCTVECSANPCVFPERQCVDATSYQECIMLPEPIQTPEGEKCTDWVATACIAGEECLAGYCFVQTCNYNGVCEAGETEENCPNDCRQTCVGYGQVCAGITGIQCCSGFVCDNDLMVTDSIGTCIVTPVCGNGIVEFGEACDSSNLNGNSCSTFGYNSGSLSCTSSCTFDTTQCSNTGTATVSGNTVTIEGGSVTITVGDRITISGETRTVTSVSGNTLTVDSDFTVSGSGLGFTTEHGCTPDDSCAVDICPDKTCTDVCGKAWQGTKNCNCDSGAMAVQGGVDLGGECLYDSDCSPSTEVCIDRYCYGADPANCRKGVCNEMVDVGQDCSPPIGGICYSDGTCDERKNNCGNPNLDITLSQQCYNLFGYGIEGESCKVAFCNTKVIPNQCVDRGPKVQGADCVQPNNKPGECDGAGFCGPKKPCVPETTCTTLAYNCGTITNDCGKTEDCGSCISDMACVNGQCQSCTPDSSCASATCMGSTCTDSCGNVYDGQCSGGCTPDCSGGCTPNCAGKSCGDDGCGGSCGGCQPGQTCDNGQCSGGCTPNCAGKSCGGDGCGGSCGSCTTGQTCNAGICVDEPCSTSFGVAVQNILAFFGLAEGCECKYTELRCYPNSYIYVQYCTDGKWGMTTECPVGKRCIDKTNSDGSRNADCVLYCDAPKTVCGDTCCDKGQTCDNSQCSDGDKCAGKSCDDGNPCTTDTCDSGTGGCSNTPVSCDDGNPCTDDSCDPGSGCVYTPSSNPDCGGGGCTTDSDCDDSNTCTDDSCDTTDGTCSSVDNGQCTCNPDCSYKSCGDDGCGGSCGECSFGQVCFDGTCVTDECSQMGAMASLYNPFVAFLFGISSDQTKCGSNCCNSGETCCHDTSCCVEGEDCMPDGTCSTDKCSNYRDTETASFQVYSGDLSQDQINNANKIYAQKIQEVSDQLKSNDHCSNIMNGKCEQTNNIQVNLDIKITDTQPGCPPEMIGYQDVSTVTGTGENENLDSARTRAQSSLSAQVLSAFGKNIEGKCDSRCDWSGSMGTPGENVELKDGLFNKYYKVTLTATLTLTCSDKHKTYKGEINVVGKNDWSCQDKAS